MTDASDHLPVADTATGVLTSPVSAAGADLTGAADRSGLRSFGAAASRNIAGAIPIRREKRGFGRDDFAITDNENEAAG